MLTVFHPDRPSRTLSCLSGQAWDLPRCLTLKYATRACSRATPLRLPTRMYRIPGAPRRLHCNREWQTFSLHSLGMLRMVTRMVILTGRRLPPQVNRPVDHPQYDRNRLRLAVAAMVHIRSHLTDTRLHRRWCDNVYELYELAFWMVVGKLIFCWNFCMGMFVRTATACYYYPPLLLHPYFLFRLTTPLPPSSHPHTAPLFAVLCFSHSAPICISHTFPHLTYDHGRLLCSDSFIFCALFFLSIPLTFLPAVRVMKSHHCMICLQSEYLNVCLKVNEILKYRDSYYHISTG